MSEAAFFYNTTTQRPATKNLSSAQKHTYKPTHSLTKVSTYAKGSNSSCNPDPKHDAFQSSSSKKCLTPPSTTGDIAPISLEPSIQDRMLPTPLPDYRLAANQSTKSRAAAAKRKSSSANSSDRKNAIQTADPRAAASLKVESHGRSSSISSTTGSSGLTATTSNDSPSTDISLLAQPFTRRNGRKCLRDTTLPYPLPCDLAEIHRQTIRTMLLCAVFNGPVCSPAVNAKPPKRVLEVGCGTGFWSVMCHRHFAQRGFSSISFTGVDIAPLAPRMDSDDDMNWRFVQHDLRRVPLPFRDDEFNLIMIKDLSLMTPTTGMQQVLMDEYLRILKPGGTLEIWDGDHSLRMLLPHVPPSTKEDVDASDDEEQIHTNAMGTYTLTPQTPFAPPHNQYLSDYNGWISKALEQRKLTPMPCTLMGPILHQESEDLIEVDSRRLAIPLGEVRWEREGVGGNVIQTVNGTSSQSLASSGKAKDFDRKLLTAAQAALRRTALMTVVQMIESLEPLLKETSGKGQDEWDRWQGNMMNDLLKQNGTSWGECLEVGAWWARKKKPSVDEV
jgi:SAM-dependent methyltransferase